jgi:serine/threonine protein kinase
MTDGPQGPGWWQAADLKWYPPEQRPDPAALPPPPAAGAAQQQPADPTPTSQQPQKPTSKRQVIERDKLGPLSQIGQGGQGVLYRAPNVKMKLASSMVYKEYKAQARTNIDFTALAAMPALVEDSLTYSQAERLISITAWPCAIIDDACTPAGFVMPAIPEEFFIPLNTAKGGSPSVAEIQHLLNHPTVLAARGITLVDAQRFSLLRQTASALAFLHKHGVCVGDVSPKNLLFSLTPREAVYFIDCDAMRINGVSALAQVETPGWDAPAGEELATIYSDAYKLGLLALRLLTGDQDTKNPAHLPAGTPAQLRQIITDTLNKEPKRRPLPEAWTYVLNNAIDGAQHQKKTPRSVSVAPALPPIPVVRSRPPVGTSAPPVPPAQPADQPPTGTGTPPSTPTSSKKTAVWAGAAAAAALIVAALVAGAVGLVKHHSTPRTATPVAEAALQGLLLSPDQIKTVPPASQGTASVTETKMAAALKLMVTDKACLPLPGPSVPEVYAGSRWSAVRWQSLVLRSANATETVQQAVVSFSSAQDAHSFFTASAQQWSACANRQYTYTVAGGAEVWRVGPVSNTNGILSIARSGKSSICQRALIVANNVAIDVGACNSQPNFAVNIAQQIAAKVPA